MSKNTARQLDESVVRRLILPITTLLDAPDDLCEFHEILAGFKPILELYKRLSDKTEIEYLSKLELLVKRILSGEISVITSIPSACARPKRRSMKPHYEKHPHYCLYWHRCVYDELQPQYHALLASFLPIQTKLQSARQEYPETFSEASYLLGLYLRQLSKPNPAEARIIRQLPSEPLPHQQLRQRIDVLFERYGYLYKMTGENKAFAYIHRVLLWFETGVWSQRSTYNRRLSHSHQAARHGGNKFEKPSEKHKTISSFQELGEPIKIRNFYTDTGDSLGTSAQDSDADPQQDSGKACESIEIPTQRATAFNAIDRIVLNRKKARYAAQAIEMGNQKLPVTHATMTGFELRVLIEILTDINHDLWVNTPQALRTEIAAWGACRLFLGRDSNTLFKMNIQTNENAHDSKDVVWFPKRQTIWLPCQSPLHKAPDDPSRVFEPNHGFTLDVTGTLAPFLQRTTSKTKRVFTRELENEFKRLLNKLNQKYCTTLTTNRISNYIPGLIAQMAPNDEVMSVYFSGQQPNQHNPCVYSAVPAIRLTSLFVQACGHVFKLAQIPKQISTLPTFPALISNNDDFVGSLHVPKLETVRTTIEDISAKLEILKNTAGTPVHELHNTYTAYVLLFLMTTTAIRAVRQPIPAKFNIDKVTGSCFVSEKDTNGYRNARVVWLHPMLVEQMDEYLRHVTRLRQHLVLVNTQALDKLDAKNAHPHLSSVDAPNRANDQLQFQGIAPTLFMLSEYSGHLIDIEPKKIEELLGKNWELRLVSLRHFLRTQLLFSGCSGTLINALLGHAERGESPWGNFSTLPPAVWRKELEHHLKPILEQLDFKVVISPLLRS